MVLVEAPNANLLGQQGTRESVKVAICETVTNAMSAAAAMKTEEVAMGLPCTNMWACTEATRLEYLQEFYIAVKTCMINGIGRWMPKRVYIIVPSSDDRLCNEMIRAATSNKSWDIAPEEKAMAAGIKCSVGAKERVRAIAELRARDSNENVATGRKIVVKNIEHSPPRARRERRETTNALNKSRPKVNAAMFIAIQKQFENRGAE